MSELYLPERDRHSPLMSKKDTGDYVETMGKLVAPRYGCLEEARHEAGQNGITRVFERSEHPQEYEGPSGLGTSLLLHPDKDGVLQPGAKQLSDEELYSSLRNYAWLTGTDAEASVDKSTVSYWKKIPGTNVTVVADDSVEDRYHIFSYFADGTTIQGAVVTTDGSVERATLQKKVSKNITHRYQDIIDFYEAVRTMPRFNAYHCPIMELQIGAADDNIYFLQYHRSRDAWPISPQLDVADFHESEWLQADAVRGVHLGTTALNVTLSYPDEIAEGGALEIMEDGSCDLGRIRPELDETLVRQRVAQIIGSTFETGYRRVAANHGTRSKLFKPQVSVLIDSMKLYDAIPKELYYEANAIAAEEGIAVGIKTYVVADGRKAFIKYTNELVSCSVEADLASV